MAKKKKKKSVTSDPPVIKRIEKPVDHYVDNKLFYIDMVEWKKLCNFDPEKSKNPFSYFTQIIYYAFLRRIEKEKKQSYIKLKMTELMDDGSVHRWFKENYFEKDTVQQAISDHFQISDNDIKKFEPKKKKKRKS